MSVARTKKNKKEPLDEYLQLPTTMSQYREMGSLHPTPTNHRLIQGLGFSSRVQSLDLRWDALEEALRDETTKPRGLREREAGSFREWDKLHSGSRRAGECSAP